MALVEQAISFSRRLFRRERARPAITPQPDTLNFLERMDRIGGVIEYIEAIADEMGRTSNARQLREQATKVLTASQEMKTLTQGLADS